MTIKMPADGHICLMTALMMHPKTMSIMPPRTMEDSSIPIFTSIRNTKRTSIIGSKRTFISNLKRTIIVSPFPVFLFLLFTGAERPTRMSPERTQKTLMGRVFFFSVCVCSVILRRVYFGHKEKQQILF